MRYSKGLHAISDALEDTAEDLYDLSIYLDDNPNIRIPATDKRMRHAYDLIVWAGEILTALRNDI